MPMTRHAVPALTAALILLAATLLLASSTLAAPITVNLRVEGSSKTLYEGPVSTEALAAPGIVTTSSPEAHPCDVKDNGEHAEGFGNAIATPTAALYDAALAQGLSFDASWSNTFHDFEVSQIGGDANGGAPEYPFWGYAVNYTTAGVGGCQFALANGSEVLWAYNYFNLSHLLSLSGPASATAGTPFTVHVTDGQTGQALAGVAIGTLSGGVTSTSATSPITDAGGNASITLPAGTQTLKATRSDSVRSNGLSVCVHAGNDGSCGTTVPGTTGTTSTTTTTSSGTGTTQSTATPKAEVARVMGVRGNHVYARRHAPRLLGGVVQLPSGATLRQVRISLQRSYRGHCFSFSGSSESFVKARCHSSSFFKVGSSASFSYLLPARLPAGHYSYAIETVDAAGKVHGATPGVGLVGFDVR